MRKARSQPASRPASQPGRWTAAGQPDAAMAYEPQRQCSGWKCVPISTPAGVSATRVTVATHISVGYCTSCASSFWPTRTGRAAAGAAAAGTTAAAGATAAGATAAPTKMVGQGSTPAAQPGVAQPSRTGSSPSAPEALAIDGVQVQQAKAVLFEQFISQNDLFTKTGSGQT